MVLHRLRDEQIVRKSTFAPSASASCMVGESASTRCRCHIGRSLTQKLMQKS